MWLVAFCLPLHENQVKAKHVESSLVPRLDEGSNPSSSTKKDAIKCLFFVLIRDENPNRGLVIAERFRRKNPSSSTKKMPTDTTFCDFTIIVYRVNILRYFYKD